MHSQLTDKEQFVQRVMSALPERESVLQRIGRYVLRLMTSPLWLWLGLVTIVLLLHRPILAVLAVLGEMTLGGVLLTMAAVVTVIGYFGYQMCKCVNV